MAGTIRLGNTTGLRFAIELLPPSAQRPSGLGWAAFTLAVGGKTVWGGEINGIESPGLEWTLVDLLHGLARIWPWLMYEEGYPIPVSPEHPGDLMVKAKARWDDMPPTVAEDEEVLLYDFRQRHDLSLLLRGIRVAPLWLLKEGLDCIVWSPSLRSVSRLAHAEVMQTLTQFGDFLNQTLQGSAEPRAQTAMTRWQGRHRTAARHYLSIATGLNTDELHAVFGAAADELSAAAAFLETSGNDETYAAPNELLMAARMTYGYMSLRDQSDLLQHISAIGHAPTEPIDALSQAAPPLDNHLPAFEEGYRLAGWLREAAGIPASHTVFPEKLLERWGIPVKQIDIPAPIDAVAVWGAHRGPCILLNHNSHSRASTENGCRTTLAHEICHLLVDRKHALPVVEVLGGQVARRAEQRANAFAAELLLPRGQVDEYCKTHRDLLEAAARLEKHYRVSRELVFNQINNSDYHHHMDGAAQRRLKDWKLETRPARGDINP